MRAMGLLALRTWAADQLFRRSMKNAGLLFTGNVLASLLGLVAVALTARGLGVELFGTLALIRAYVTIVDRLVNFQSWQAMIRYGAEALERRHDEEFKRLIKFGTLLDAATAVAGAAIGASAVYWIGQWRGWNPEVIHLASLYSLSILFNLSGTPKAILRLFDRFTLFAWQQVAASVFKLVGVVFALMSRSSLGGFLVIWMLTDILGYLLLLALGWRELKRRGFSGILTRTSLQGVTRQHPGLWGFVWLTNLDGSARMALKELDTLIVGGLLGVASAGLYQVAKQCAKIIDQVSDPLYEAMYPELAKLWARKDTHQMRRVMVRSGLVIGSIAVLIWLGFLIAGGWFLRVVFGAAFVSAHAVLVWYLLAMTIDAFLFPLPSALLAMGRAGSALRINLVSALAFFPALVVLARTFGLPGTGMAFVLQYLIWALGMLGATQALLKRKADVRIATVGVVPVSTVSVEELI